MIAWQTGGVHLWSLSHAYAPRVANTNMTSFELTVDIDAPIARVWATTVDIERWPEWTTTVTRAKLHGRGPFNIGSRVTIHQPRLPPAVWKVTAFETGRHVALKSGFPGMVVIAHHAIVPRGEGCRLTLSLRFEGWLGKRLGRLMADLNERYLAIEADGIKRRCELADV